MKHEINIKQPNRKIQPMNLKISKKTKPMNLKISRKTKPNQKCRDFCQMFVISKKKLGLWERKPFRRYWI